MKLDYVYGDTVIGQLEKKADGKFIYTPNVTNQKKLLERNKALGGLERGLWNSESIESDELLAAFDRVIKDFSREDIIKKAQINAEDTKWDKLVKLSKLNVFASTFHVRQEQTDRKLEFANCGGGKKDL